MNDESSRIKWREKAARYLDAHRDEVNARKRAAWLLNLDENRAKTRARVKTLYHANPDRMAKAKESSRKSRLWVCFRLTVEEYDAMLAYQDGVCASCGVPPERVRLAVDHCHKTGRIRGLLCWVCNRALGFIRDNVDTADGLALYLMSPPAPLALGKETFGLIGKALPSKKVKIYGPPVPKVVVRKRKP